jgi:hypothetical protein
MLSWRTVDAPADLDALPVDWDSEPFPRPDARAQALRRREVVAALFGFDPQDPAMRVGWTWPHRKLREEYASCGDEPWASIPRLGAQYMVVAVGGHLHVQQLTWVQPTRTDVEVREEASRLLLHVASISRRRTEDSFGAKFALTAVDRFMQVVPYFRARPRWMTTIDDLARRFDCSRTTATRTLRAWRSAELLEWLGDGIPFQGVELELDKWFGVWLQGDPEELLRGGGIHLPYENDWRWLPSAPPRPVTDEERDSRLARALRFVAHHAAQRPSGLTGVVEELSEDERVALRRALTCQPA